MKSDAPKHHPKRARVAHAAAVHHASKPKVFDVMRPGKVPAAPTSRPVIVGHKPSAQKSQLAVSGVGESTPAATATKTKVEIKPLHAAELEHAVQVAAAASVAAATPAVGTGSQDTPVVAPSLVPPVETSGPVAPVVDSVPAQPAAPEPVPAPGPPAVPEDIAAKTGTAGSPLAPPGPDDPPAPLLGDLPKQVDEPAQEQASAPLAAIEPAPAIKAAEDSQAKLVEEEPFEIRDIVVSHHGPSTGWTAILLFILVLLLAAAAGDILLDAEVLDIPAIPRTDYF